MAKKKNLNYIKKYKMSLEQLKKYYLELRQYEYNNNIPIKGIKIRKFIHKIPLTMVKLERFFLKEKVTVIADKSQKNTKPIIYACTHIGGNDIQRVYEAINSPAYLFLGDPGEAYRDLTSVLLFFNGAIYLETDNKNDRYIAKQRAIELLNKGGNLYIFPEGAWNIFENLPVMELYNGTVKIAQETGADIIPIAVEQIDNNFLVNIGKNIHIGKDDDINTANNNLRDTLATLKWEIWEKLGVYNRNEVACETKESFQQNIIKKCKYNFTVDDVYSTMYKNPNHISQDEVFNFVKQKTIY